MRGACRWLLVRWSVATAALTGLLVYPGFVTGAGHPPAGASEERLSDSDVASGAVLLRIDGFVQHRCFRFLKSDEDDQKEAAL